MPLSTTEPALPVDPSSVPLGEWPLAAISLPLCARVAPDAVSLPLCTPIAPDAAVAPEAKLPLPEPEALPLDCDVVAPLPLACPTAAELPQPNAETTASTGNPRWTKVGTNDVSRRTCRRSDSQRVMRATWGRYAAAITIVTLGALFQRRIATTW